jgi:hypothetical protein
LLVAALAERRRDRRRQRDGDDVDPVEGADTAPRGGEPL